MATNRGEPLVLQKKLTLSGIAFENAARRLIGKQVRGGARKCWGRRGRTPHCSYLKLAASGLNQGLQVALGPRGLQRVGEQLQGRGCRGLNGRRSGPSALAM